MLLLKNTYTRPISYSIIIIVLLQGCSIQEQREDIFLKAAENQENLNDFSAAESTLLKITGPNDTNTDSDFLPLEAQIKLATCYLRNRKYTSTIQACQKALSLSEKVYGANNNLKTTILFTLASAQTGLKQYDEAINTLKTVLTLLKQTSDNYPARSVAPLIKLGDLELKRNHVHLAINYYEEADSVQSFASPASNVLSYRLALSYLLIGQEEKAESYLRNLSLNPSPTELAFGYVMPKYSQLLRKNGRLTESIKVDRSITTWKAKHAKYKQWLVERHVSPDSRFYLREKYADQDLPVLSDISSTLK